MATNKTYEVAFAYHVTNVMVPKQQTGCCNDVDELTSKMAGLQMAPTQSKELEKIKKEWLELKMTTNAINPYFQGPMVSLIDEGVAMSTSLYKKRLPTISPYPTGAENGDYYFRVKVPLKRFRDYRIIHCKSQTTKQGVTQVSYLLVDPNNAPLMKTVDEKIKEKKVTEVTDQKNECLFRDQRTKKWYTNNYSKKNKVWVNIFIPHSVDLGDDCEWDTVEHQEPRGFQTLQQ